MGESGSAHDGCAGSAEGDVPVSERSMNDLVSHPEVEEVVRDALKRRPRSEIGSAVSRDVEALEDSGLPTAEALRFSLAVEGDISEELDSETDA